MAWKFYQTGQWDTVQFASGLISGTTPEEKSSDPYDIPLMRNLIANALQQMFGSDVPIAYNSDVETKAFGSIQGSNIYRSNITIQRVAVISSGISSPHNKGPGSDLRWNSNLVGTYTQVQSSLEPSLFTVLGVSSISAALYGMLTELEQATVKINMQASISLDFLNYYRCRFCIERVRVSSGGIASPN